jgi:hypothetical protein
MSREELVGRLLVAEERCGGVEAVTDGVEHLRLTEEQWEARRRRSKECSSESNDKHSGNKEGTDVDEEPILM